MSRPILNELVATKGDGMRDSQTPIVLLYSAEGVPLMAKATTKKAAAKKPAAKKPAAKKKAVKKTAKKTAKKK